jgi:hypothetical protein
LPTLTVSLGRTATVAGAILALASVISAQNRSDLTQRYGNSIGEVYRTSNQLMVTAYFDRDGNICRERIESENRGRRMTDEEVNTVLDEIAPKNERGNYIMGTFLNIICVPDNDCAGVSENYERLLITKTGDTNEYRYVSVSYHSAECRRLEADKKD